MESSTIADATSEFLPLNCSLPGTNCTHPEEEGVNLNADLYMNVLYMCIGAIGVTGNSLVAGVLLHFRSMRRSLTNTFIINQCFVDGAASLCIMLSVYIRDVTWISSLLGQELFCRLWLTNMPIWGIFVSSTYNMVAVTYERYSALVYPFSHHNYFTRKKALIIIAVIWVSGPAFNAAYMIPTSGMAKGQCTVFTFWPNALTQTAVGVLTVVLQYFIPLGLVIYAYARIAIVLTKGVGQSKSKGNKKVKKDRKDKKDKTNGKGQTIGDNNDSNGNTTANTNGKTQTNCSTDDNSRSDEAKKSKETSDDAVNKTRENRISRAKRNVIKTLALVSACFVFCWSWNQIFFTMYNCGYPVDFNSRFYHFTVIMVFCNCCLNPIIYAVKYEQFQRGLRKLVCGKGRGDGATMASRSISGDSEQSGDSRAHRTVTKVISDPTIVKSNNGLERLGKNVTEVKDGMDDSVGEGVGESDGATVGQTVGEKAIGVTDKVEATAGDSVGESDGMKANEKTDTMDDNIGYTCEESVGESVETSDAITTRL